MPDKKSTEKPPEAAKKEEPAKKGGRFGLGSPMKSVRGSERDAASSPKAYMTSIDERLNKAIERAAPAENRSPELVKLSKDFEVMRKQLRSLIAVTKKYSKAYIEAETSRAEMINELGKLSESTPLHGDIGKAKNSESFAHINQTAAKEANENAVEFNKKIVEYVIEWETVVSSRIDSDLKETRALGRNRSHYETKVDKLRKEINDQEKSGRVPAEAKVEKLKRNEEKLKEQFEKHEAAAARTCVLIEQVVEYGWKDLYPLVKSIMNWEINRVQGESEIFGELPNVVDRLSITYKASKKK